MADYEIKQTLDCSGVMCPMPIVKTSNALKSMQVGEVLQMISTDPGVMSDMEAWAKQTRHELLSAVEEGSQYLFLVKKTH